MNISQQTQDLIIELNEFSGSKLKNIPDLTNVVEIASRSGNYKLYNDIQFFAKYVNGLSKILQDSISVSSNREGFSLPAERAGEAGVSPQSEEEAKEKIKREFKTNILKFTELFKELLKHADKDIKREFENKYLSLTKESMLNLNTLIYDLSWLKKYNNSKRS